MTTELYYIAAGILMVAGLVFKSGQRLEKIEGKLDKLHDLPDRVTKIEAVLETWTQPKRRR